MTNLFIHILAVAIEPGGLPTPDANTSAVQTVLGIVFGIIGAFAVVMVVVSGLRYITSAGDSQKATKAKDGLAYSLVGLAIAITAEAIVAFVVRNV